MKAVVEGVMRWLNDARCAAVIALNADDNYDYDGGFLFTLKPKKLVVSQQPYYVGEVNSAAHNFPNGYRTIGHWGAADWWDARMVCVFRNSAYHPCYIPKDVEMRLWEFWESLKGGQEHEQIHG